MVTLVGLAVILQGKRVQVLSCHKKRKMVTDKARRIIFRIVELPH